MIFTKMLLFKGKQIHEQNGLEMKAYWEDVIKNVGVGQGFVKITITFGILSYQK